MKIVPSLALLLPPLGLISIYRTSAVASAAPSQQCSTDDGGFSGCVGGEVENKNRHDAAVRMVAGYMDSQRAVGTTKDEWKLNLRTVIADANILMGASMSSDDVDRVLLEAAQTVKKKKTERESTAGIDKTGNDKDEKTGITYADRSVTDRYPDDSEFLCV